MALLNARQVNNLISNALYVNNPWLYLPSGWNTVWKAAKAASGATPARILFFGDSTSSGSTTSNWRTKPWPMLVRSNLISQYGLAGDYWPVSRNSLVESTTPSHPWTVAGSFNVNSFGLGATYYYASGNVPNLTFNSANTPTPNCTTLEWICLSQPSGGARTYTITIDGGAGNVINAPSAGNVLQKASPWGVLASAPHTLAWTAQSADAVLYSAGVNQWQNQNAGIFFTHQDWAGMQLWDPYGRAFARFPADRVLLFQGPTGGDNNTVGFGTPLQPHLAIIAIGVNDCQTQVGYEAFQRTLGRLCQALRRGCANCSIMIMAMANPDPTNNDSTSGLLIDSQNWPFYVDRMVRVAHEFGCAFINIHGKWVDQAVTRGFIGATNAHPVDAGHADIYSVLQAVI